MARTSFFGLLKTAWNGVSQDKVPMMGAALSYYTAFSIAPMLVIALAIVGLAYGEEGGTKVLDGVSGLVGEKGGQAIRDMVQSAASRPQAGKAAGIIGVLTLLLGASGVFTQLQESLNVIWKVAKKPSAGWWSTIRQRLLSFGMVGAIAFLLLVSLVVSAALNGLSAYLGEGLAWEALNAAVSIAVTAFLFGAIFKVLPDVKLRWRDVLVGGLFTAVLFTLGRTAIGAYIGRSSVASMYGAAGSLIVVLLWVFYSSQLVLFGAEFTQAYATRGGRLVEPKDDATVTVTPFTAAAMAEKAAQGKVKGAPTPLPGGAAWSLGAAASIAAGGLCLALARRLRGNREVVARVGGGVLFGAGAALLALLELPKRLKAPPTAAEEEAEQDEPSVASKVIKKIPTRVKVATVAGAVKGGGREAAREVKEKVREKVGAER